MGDQVKYLQIPTIQKRSIAKILAEYEIMTTERGEASVRVYASGAYSYREQGLLWTATSSNRKDCSET
jgi:hypothetical protein